MFHFSRRRESLTFVRRAVGWLAAPNRRAELAAVIAGDLRRQHRKTGLMDLRIAAIAIAHHATLVTANVRDFVLIDGLKVEDWTK